MMKPRSLPVWISLLSSGYFSSTCTRMPSAVSGNLEPVNGDGDAALVARRRGVSNTVPPGILPLSGSPPSDIHRVGVQGGWCCATQRPAGQVSSPSQGIWGAKRDLATPFGRKRQKSADFCLKAGLFGQQQLELPVVAALLGGPDPGSRGAARARGPAARAATRSWERIESSVSSGQSELHSSATKLVTRSSAHLDEQLADGLGRRRVGGAGRSRLRRRLRTRSSSMQLRPHPLDASWRATAGVTRAGSWRGGARRVPPSSRWRARRWGGVAARRTGERPCSSISRGRR